MFQFGTKFFNHYFRTPLGAQNTEIFKKCRERPEKEKDFFSVFFLKYKYLYRPRSNAC